MGKSSFALNIATRVAMKQRIPVAIFSLEMTKEQLTNRILSAEAGIDSQAFRTGALTASDWEYLALATEKLHDAPIYMDDTSSITITEMKAKIRRINQDPSRPNIGLIVIDYLQLMTSGLRTENRVQEISTITRNLKIMAKEMNVPIIALSQLSRAVEKQGNNSSHRPQLSDLRDSGSIEQDADCVLFLYRDSYYASQQPDGAEVDADTAECIVAKTATARPAWSRWAGTAPTPGLWMWISSTDMNQNKDNFENMQARVLAYCRQAGLFAHGQRVAAAVSGGADSMALLRHPAGPGPGRWASRCPPAMSTTGCAGPPPTPTRPSSGPSAPGLGVPLRAVYRAGEDGLPGASGGEAGARALRYACFARAPPREGIDRIATGPYCHRPGRDPAVPAGPGDRAPRGGGHPPGAGLSTSGPCSA